MTGNVSDGSKYDGDEQQIETRGIAPARKQGGGFAKVKRHCARFWWLHLIIFCVVFLIIALCL